jgi:hypothetical protein
VKKLLDDDIGANVNRNEVVEEEEEENEVQVAEQTFDDIEVPLYLFISSSLQLAAHDYSTI